MKALACQARQTGCAFWDTTAAMGGAGSFAEWHRRGLASDDLKHLSPSGRRVIAARFFAAMMHGRAGRSGSRAGN